MSKDIEEMLKEAPELTLSPLSAGGVEETQLVQTESVLKEVKEVPAADLTPEEERQVTDFAEKIDLRDSNLILQYGAGAQKKIADFSEAALDNVKSKDLGEVGQILSEVVVELKSIEVEEEEKGLFGLFKKKRKPGGRY